MRSAIVSTALVQDLAEKLFARVHKSGGERFEMRLRMMQVCPFLCRCASNALMLLWYSFGALLIRLSCMFCL